MMLKEGQYVDMNRKMGVMSKHPLFSVLPDDEYDFLQIDQTERQIKSAAFIYFEADRHPNIYLLNAGLIRLGYLDSKGNKIIKEILRPGDFFGQVSLEKESLHGEFAQAVNAEVRYNRFTVDRFNEMLNNHPRLALNYSRISGYRIARFKNRMENILRNDMKTRLRTFLEQMISDLRDSAKWFGQEVRIPAFLTHEEIAQLIGTSRQTVTSLLGTLKEQHICSYSRRELRFFKCEKPDATCYAGP